MTTIMVICTVYVIQVLICFANPGDHQNAQGKFCHLNTSIATVNVLNSLQDQVCRIICSIGAPNTTQQHSNQ